MVNSEQNFDSPVVSANHYIKPREDKREAIDQMYKVFECILYSGYICSGADPGRGHGGQLTLLPEPYQGSQKRMWWHKNTLFFKLSVISILYIITYTS